MALRRSLLRIDKASLLETFGSLKIRNFGYTPSCLQLLRKSMSNFSLFFFYSNFSGFQKSLTENFHICVRYRSRYLCILLLGHSIIKVSDNFGINTYHSILKEMVEFYSTVVVLQMKNMI